MVHPAWGWAVSENQGAPKIPIDLYKRKDPFRKNITCLWRRRLISPNKSIERVTIVTMSPKSLAKQMVILMTQERSPAQVFSHPKTCRQISPQCCLYVPHLISKHKSLWIWKQLWGCKKTMKFQQISPHIPSEVIWNKEPSWWNDSS